MHAVYNLLATLVRLALTRASEEDAEVLRDQLAAVRIAMRRENAVEREHVPEPAPRRPRLVLAALWDDGGGPVSPELRERLTLAISQVLEEEG